jgi:processive 1,2-diacylglycerol beta-glucosyltransferase
MPTGARPSIAVVSGSYGAGHDVVARELAVRLRGTGVQVGCHDVADLLSWRVGRLLRWAYFRQLRVAPETWGSTLRMCDADRTKAFCRSMLAAVGDRVLEAVSGADLVVSTHPFASQVLGQARGRGGLRAPVVTYLTDASVHPLWVNPAVDLHLAIHDVAAAQARVHGARVRVVQPVIPSPVRRLPSLAWMPPWDVQAPAALVVGGSHGVGRLRQTATDVVETGVMTPVVACGDNDRLRRGLERIPGVVALGWRSDLPQLMEASSCVIQNAGGISSLEALVAGTPTVTYRPLPGHGLSNALALDRAGLVPYLASTSELADALTSALAESLPGAQLPSGPDAVDVISALLAGRDSDPTAVAA